MREIHITYFFETTKLTNSYKENTLFLLNGLIYTKLAATPLEDSSGTLNVFFLYLKYAYVAFDVYVFVELSF